MLDRGLIDPTGQGGGARRVSATTSAGLTGAGEELYGWAVSIARRHQLALLDRLSQDERLILYAVLHRLDEDA